MIINGPYYVNDIGLVSTAGTIVTGSQNQNAILLDKGSTEVYVGSKKKEAHLQAAIIIAEGPTTATSVYPSESSPDEKPIILHNPMIAFWKRADLYFQSRKQYVIEKGYILRLEDVALIISDLGQSLYMLFGRHWHDEAIAKYVSKVGTSPTAKTPDLLALLEKYYPPLGWDLPTDNFELWSQLKDFIRNYYQDIIKHFDYSKFEPALSITIEVLASFMEITRRTWLWFMEKPLGLRFDVHSEAFQYFTESYYKFPW